MSRHIPTRKPAGLVEKMLSEDDRQAHHDLWDKACDVSEKEGEDSPATEFINLLAQVYNGGFDQYVYNGYVDQFHGAVSYLRMMKCDAAKALVAKLRPLGSLLTAAKEAEEAAAEQSRRGEGDEESDPFEQFQNDFGIVEDFIYNDANIDPILAEMTGVTPSTPQPPASRPPASSASAEPGTSAPSP